MGEMLWLEGLEVLGSVTVVLSSIMTLCWKVKQWFGQIGDKIDLTHEQGIRTQKAVNQMASQLESISSRVHQIEINEAGHEEAILTLQRNSNGRSR